MPELVVGTFKQNNGKHSAFVRCPNLETEEEAASVAAHIGETLGPLMEEKEDDREAGDLL